nr:4Fe-4S binding protein [Dehalococcoides sp. UCH007]
MKYFNRVISNRSRIVTLLALLSLGLAALYGFTHQDLGYKEYIPQVVSADSEYTELMATSQGVLYGILDDEGQMESYVTISQGQGYGGPLLVALDWSLDGIIQQISVPVQHEDLPWWRVLEARHFFEQYIGRGYEEPIQIHEDIDAVSGSTVSSNGVAMAVKAGRLLIVKELGSDYKDPLPGIKFGLPELLVCLGLVFVFWVRTFRPFKNPKYARYLALAYSFFIVGIWLSVPLSLNNISSFLVGYAPSLEQFIIFYIVVWGILGLAILFGKNYYCYWMCPFSAVQEGLHFIGEGVSPSANAQKRFKWVRYLLLWLALMLVFIFRAPNISGFEPWNLLFSLKGDFQEWILMIATLVGALLFYNFWCNYLCPVGASLDIIIKVRKWVGNKWKSLLKKKARR